MFTESSGLPDLGTTVIFTWGRNSADFLRLLVRWVWRVQREVVASRLGTRTPVHGFPFWFSNL